MSITFTATAAYLAALSSSPCVLTSILELRREPSTFLHALYTEPVSPTPSCFANVNPRSMRSPASSSLSPMSEDRLDRLLRTAGDDIISSSVIPNAAADIAPRSPPDEGEGEGEGDEESRWDEVAEPGERANAGACFGAQDMDGCIGDVPV